MSKHQFQTEVNQLLHLIIHSLYSHREIFLRELISNSSDAIDRLRYLTLTDDTFRQLAAEPRIDISFTEGGAGATLTIADNGLGMSAEEMAENLGTIAKSGTRGFISKMTGDERKDSNLIGQFGVGFYSSFMVADKVDVVSRKAGSEQANRWSSDGKGEYEIETAERDEHGTTVILHLNEEGAEYASRWKIETVIKKYSNHIAFPIFLHYEETRSEGKDSDKKEIKEQKIDQVNAASALWKRPKNELKDEDYQEFYKTISHDFENPLHYVHTKAEGQLDYTTLFYIPAKAPFDLFRADYAAGVKLYVKRVFITDDEKELLPTYLRFVRGVIDTEDLPLNVSREILQQNKVLTKIKSSSVKKILSELESIRKNDREKYLKIYGEFGVPIKEGLYSDFENRDKIIDLVLFKSTKREGSIGLDEYVAAMQPDQKAVYYITGRKEDNLRNSPLLEMYKSKDIEVLILDDEIDEIIISSVPKYGEVELRSVNRSDSADDLKTDSDKNLAKEMEPVIARIKEALGDLVKDVRASGRLTDSPSCIVADETDPTVQMQHIMKAMGQKNLPDFKPILEVNPSHEIVKKLQDTSDQDLVKDASFLLFEQAMLIEGIELKSPAEFAHRLNRVLSRAL